jgi:hypothetical protein
MWHSSLRAQSGCLDACPWGRHFVCISCLLGYSPPPPQISPVYQSIPRDLALPAWVVCYAKRASQGGLWFPDSCPSCPREY